MNTYSNAEPLSPAWRADFRDLFEAALANYAVAQRNFWRAANALPTFRPWVEAMFRVHLGELPVDGGPEHPLNAAGAAFWAEAHELPAYKRMVKAASAQQRVSRAFMPTLIKEGLLP
jgi:hypothetical protein